MRALLCFALHLPIGRHCTEGRHSTGAELIIVISDLIANIKQLVICYKCSDTANQRTDQIPQQEGSAIEIQVVQATSCCSNANALGDRIPPIDRIKATRDQRQQEKHQQPLRGLAIFATHFVDIACKLVDKDPVVNTTGHNR